MRVRKARYC